ncbi:MAG: sulfotransferase [Saprospiraceae bacterium]|nr:sulfotransferase [Saprospiraceae bacterium]
MWQSIKQCIKFMYAHLFFCYILYKKQELVNSHPIFIVGCGHSGTSLMIRILDTHSTFFAFPHETGILSFERNDNVIFWKFYRAYATYKTACSTRFIEKTPRHIYHIPTIFRLFPNAKIILMLRDGRDVACSIRNRYHYFEKGVRRWVDDNEIARPYWHDPRVITQRLEDLQYHPEVSLRRILHFLDAPFEAKMLDYHTIPRNFYAEKIQYTEGRQGEDDHRVRRNWQINQPLQKDTSRWKAEMSVAEKQFFKQHAQYLLEEWAYATDDNW